MNPEDTAVIDAADELVAAWEQSQSIGTTAIAVRVSDAAQALHQAVRARTPQSMPPDEPPNGAIVRLRNGENDHGFAYRTDWIDAKWGCWHKPGSSAVFRWAELALPGMAVEEYVPASLARRLVDELEQTHVSEHTYRCPPGMSTDCRSDECVRRNELVDEARARIGGA